MSRDLDQSNQPLTSIDQLVDYFRSGAKGESARLGVGTEHEKFVFHKADRSLIAYEGAGGMGELFEALEARGWTASRDRGRIVALERRGAAITLEPGGQLELSGAILHTATETEAELDEHLREIIEMRPDLDLVCWGLNPFDDITETPVMPKARYDVMRSYLPTRGDLALWMMKGTCTVQANFDYRSESDAVDLITTAARVTPIVSALFANSPYKQGADTEMASYRCHIWTRTDPDRTGLPDFLYRDDWGFSDYVDYALGIPMFFIRREGGYLAMNGALTFGDFIERGHHDYAATLGDFELHLSTIFPEIRMKRYVEVRGADAGPRQMILALPPLWKGLLYDASSRRAARALVAELDPKAHRALLGAAARSGLDAHTPLGPMRALAGALVRISAEGLDRIAERDGHDSERPYLAPLADAEHAPAEALRRAWAETGGDRGALIDRFKFEPPRAPPTQ